MKPILDTHVVIQAGGRGERLRPLTDATPKPLLKVAGQPIIDRLLYDIKEAGFKHTSVITGWQGDSLAEHIQRNTTLYGDMTIECFAESKSLGNVGGLSMLTITAPRILFLFADLVTDLDFVDLLQKHCESQADLTLASHHDEYQVQFGELFVSEQKVISYLEKPLKKTLVGSGVAVFDTNIVKQVITGEPMGISDFVNHALQQDANVTHWFHQAMWIDVNSVEALEKANQLIGQTQTQTQCVAD